MSERGRCSAREGGKGKYEVSTTSALLFKVADSTLGEKTGSGEETHKSNLIFIHWQFRECETGIYLKMRET